MKRHCWQIKCFIGGVVILLFIVQYSLAIHKHKHKKDHDDDDDDDDDDDCYPGRNCRPGCYCAGTCRPYFPPHSDYLKKYQCTGYNYPKWKLYKKSKNDGSNSTVMVVVAHHNDNGEPGISLFLKENNFTTYDNYVLPVPVVKAPANILSVNNGNQTTSSSVIDLIHATSTTVLPPSTRLPS